MLKLTIQYIRKTNSRAPLVSAFSLLTQTPCRFYRKSPPPNVDPNKPPSLYDFHGLSEEDKKTELFKILN